MTAFIVHIAGIFENRQGTINLQELWRNFPRSDVSETLQAQVEVLFAETRSTARGLQILRSNAFAHRSAGLEYNAAFKKAKLTPDAIRRSIEIALELVNLMRTARGSEPISFDEIAINDLRVIASTPIA